MGGLCPRRNRPVIAVQRAGRAVTEGEDVFIPRRLQCPPHDELVHAVCLEPVEPLQEIRRPDAGCPDLHLRGNEIAAVRVKTLRRCFGNALPGEDPDAQLPQGFCRLAGEPGGQGGQDLIGGLDDRYLHILLGRDPVEAVFNELAAGFVQLCGQLHAGGARPRDRDVQLPFPQRLMARVRGKVISQQKLVKPVRLVPGVEKHAVLFHPGQAEIIGNAAHGDHQGVVAEGPARYIFVALFIQRGREADFTFFPVQAIHSSEPERKMMPVGLGHVAQFILV